MGLNVYYFMENAYVRDLFFCSQVVEGERVSVANKRGVFDKYQGVDKSHSKRFE